MASVLNVPFAFHVRSPLTVDESPHRKLVLRHAPRICIVLEGVLVQRTKIYFGHLSGCVVERVAHGIGARAGRNRLRPSNAVQAISDGGQTSQVLDFVQSTAGEVRRSDVIVAARMGRRLVNIPWKRLNAAATAPPSGSSPIASRPAVAAPLAIAFWMQGFLYHGVWLFAAQG